MRGGVVAARHGIGHGEQRKYAPQERDRGAERYQRIHVGGAVCQCPETADKEFPVDEHDDTRQKQLDQSQPDVVVRQPGGQRESPHHMPHRNIHEHQQKSDRPAQPAHKVRRFPVGERIVRCRGIRARCLRPFRCGAVARFSHGFHNGVRTGIALHAHGVGQQADGAGRNARHGRYRLLHAGGAGGTAHACDGILLYFFVIHTYLLLHLHGFSFPTGFVGITHGVIIYQKSVLVNRKNGFSWGTPLKIHGGYDIM